MSVSTIGKPNFQTINCDKIVATNFVATTINNTSPTVELYQITNNTNTQVIYKPFTNNERFLGTWRAIATRDEFVATFSFKLQMELTNLFNSLQRISIRAKMEKLDPNNGAIIQTFNLFGGDSIWQYIPRSVNENVNVSLEIPFTNNTLDTGIFAGDIYRCGLYITNDSSQKLKVGAPPFISTSFLEY